MSLHAASTRHFLLLAALLGGCGATHSGADAASGLVDAGTLVDAASATPDAHPVTDDAAVDLDAARPRVDLVVWLRDFDTLDGRRATVRATDTSIGETHGPVSATLVGGDADLLLPGAFVRDLFGELGHLWIDTDGDGACVDGVDVAYGFFINNDFEMGPETVLVSATDPMLAASSCAEAGE